MGKYGAECEMFLPQRTLRDAEEYETEFLNPTSASSVSSAVSFSLSVSPCLRGAMNRRTIDAFVEQGGAAVVGLHDARPRASRRRGPAYGRRSAGPRAARLHGEVLRHARRLLSGRGAGIHQRLAAGDARQAGRHLRTDRADRAVAARGPAGQRARAQSASTATSGAWTSGPSTATKRPTISRSSFAKADMELCFNRIGPSCGCRERTCTFPRPTPDEYIASYDQARCVVMQGGQGEVKHWAFNDPPRREGQVQGRRRRRRPSIASSTTRIVDLHPMTIIQNARTSGGGVVTERADAGDHRRAGRNVEGREGLDLARRQARQSVRPCG